MDKHRSGQKANIVVDMLDCFCRTGNLTSPRLDSTTGRPREHLAREHVAGADLAFLADTHAVDDREFAKFPPHGIAGSGEKEIVPALADLAARGQVVRKRAVWGFYGTRLETLLE